MSENQDLVFDPSGDVLLLLKKEITATETDGGSVKNTKIVQKFEIKVSSRHLALASRVFRVMFGGQFRERIDSDDGHLAKVSLPEDDPDALVILLGITHGLSRRIPRRIDSQTFLAVVILIDKYEFHEMAEVFTDMWFVELWKPGSERESPDSEWIFICWVLNKELEFRNLTMGAILDNERPYGPEDVLFPCEIAGKITSLPFNVYAQHIEYSRDSRVSFGGNQEMSPTPQGTARHLPRSRNSVREQRLRCSGPWESYPRIQESRALSCS